MVQKRGTKAINKLCVREILGLSFCVELTFLNFAAGSREGTHAHCLFHACRPRVFLPSFRGPRDLTK